MSESLPLVSDHAEEIAEAQEPKYGKAYAYQPSVQLWDNHLFVKGHPFDEYKALREKAPIAWNHEGAYGAGYWSVVHYEDIRVIELDAETFSSQKGGINMNYGQPETRHPELFQAALNTMICLDQPWHLPLRREHMPFFTPAYVTTLKAKVATKIDALLDAMAQSAGEDHNDIDFVANFSAQLPMFTLCEMLGIPESDRPKLIEWMHLLELAGETLARRGIGDIDPAFIMKFLTEMTNLFAYGRDILNDRRHSPREDLLSAIANAKINGEYLQQEYLDGSWLLILFAGNDTTRNSLSGAIRLLTEFPLQKEKLLNNPELTENCVHEVIRMVTPVIYMRRTATKDRTIRNQKIAEGEKVLLYYGAANRDPAIFENPDMFDIERANAKDHIAFGMGTHVCLGKRIANMQLEIALTKILARFPKIQWTGEIEIAPNNFVHAISRLNVNLNR